LTKHCIYANYTIQKSLIRNLNKTTRIPGTLPTLNLPQKSFSVPKVERPTVSIQKRAESHVVAAESPDCYKSIAEFNVRVRKLKLSLGWEIKEAAEFILILYMDSEHVIPKYQIFVKNDLSYNLLVYNWEVIKSNKILSNTVSSSDTSDKRKPHLQRC